jgi:hypothetical protein
MLIALALPSAVLSAAPKDYILCVSNHSDYQTFTLTSDDVLLIFANTSGLVFQILLDANDSSVSSPIAYIYGSTSLESTPLTVPFVLFSPASVDDFVIVKPTRALNISVWSLNRSVCGSYTSVLASDAEARFRLNYAEDSVGLRCFFPHVMTKWLTFDYWVDANVRFDSPSIAVYTADNWSAGLGPWLNQTSPISKAQTTKPVFFTVMGMHRRSQLAINLNFTTDGGAVQLGCEFRTSPVWNGSGLIEPSETDLSYKQDCQVSGGSKTMWMYLAYGFIADGSLLLVVAIAWCKFRQWHKNGDGRDVMLMSLGQGRQNFARRGSLSNVERFPGD